MATNAPGNEANLRAFLEMAGRSLSEAQGVIGPDLEMATGMLIANAELEIKAALQSDARGNLSLQTLSAQEIRAGGIDPGVLSTLRVSFVATTSETLRTVDQPKRRPDDVVREVVQREDIALLDQILGGLTIKADYVPQQGRWLVTAHDPKNRLVREIVVTDQITEGQRG